MRYSTIYAIHAPDPDKLDKVKAQMEILGTPTIEVVDCGDHYVALEGSHRLAAAQALGLAPTLTIHEQDDLLDITRFDWFEPQNWSGTTYTAGEVAGELSSMGSVPYQF